MTPTKVQDDALETTAELTSACLWKTTGRSEPSTSQPVVVLYATREGQTRKIAEVIALGLKRRDIGVDLREVAQAGDLDLTGYKAAILAASVHAGSHESEMLDFIKKHKSTLEKMPNAFVSVTLSQAGVERPNSTASERETFARGVSETLDRFVEQTGWLPGTIKPVAGALIYSRYNPFVRLILRGIAKKAGADTDVSRDYEYTNWADLDHFVEGIASEISSSAPHAYDEPIEQPTRKKS